MDFEELLEQAQSGNKEAELSIIEMYRPLIIKKSLVCGVFDEDLHQELLEQTILCIRKYRELK